MKNKTLILLVIITFIGGFLRLYQLGNIPVGLHRDEAFLGYNGYSILKTGKDMSGDILPIHLKSFLYSPAGYSYATIPAISVFGLNEFSVRLASALFGIFTIPILFLFVISVFSRHPHSNSIALLSAFFLSVSPWHINLSRTATENTIVVFFIMCGIYVFNKWVFVQKLQFLLLSYALLALTLFIYQAPRAFLPLFVPFLLHAAYLKNRARVLFPFLLFIVTIVIPILIILISPNLSLRLTSVSIFNAGQTQLTIDESIREDGVSNISAKVSRSFHNKLLGYSDQFLKNYFSHFTYSFLFTDGGFPERYKIPNMGLLYLLDLPILLFGCFVILKKDKKNAYFLLGWISIAFVGSGLTSDDIPNLQRTLQAAPAIYCILAYGWIDLYIRIRNIQTKKVFFFVCAVLYILSISYYLHQYYIHQIVHRPWFRQEGYKNLVAKVQSILPSYQKVVITNHETAPTIFFLFYTRYSPLRFQEEIKNKSVKDFDRVGFSNYEFSTLDCPLNEVVGVDTSGLPTIISHTHIEHVLYVNSFVCNTPSKFGRILNTIKRSDGSSIFQILD